MSDRNSENLGGNRGYGAISGSEVGREGSGVGSASGGAVEWGPAIAVDGKRPGYLRDGECIAYQYAYQRAEGFWHGTHGVNFYPNDPDNGEGWDNVRFIRLPADHPHYRQPAPINWSGELEAVHEDGRVVAIDRRDTTKRNDGGWFVTMLGANWIVADDGEVLKTAWRIRNATPQPTPQADTKPDVTARMEALVRRMALADICSTQTDLVQQSIYDARAIVALLPGPVDPDLIEARNLVECTVHWSPQTDRDLQSGKNDGTPEMKIALAAIKRGRVLALAGETEA